MLSKKSVGFAPESLAEVIVEIGKLPDSGVDGAEIAQVEPLLGEVVDQRLRPLVGQHPPHLLLEHPLASELAAHSHVEQLFVGNTAPEEKREPRRELDVADLIRRPALTPDLS